MSRFCRRRTAWAVAALLGLAALAPVSAAVQPQKSPEAAALEFRLPQLFIQNVYRSVGELPGGTSAAAQRDLAALGLESNGGRLDLRSGRWGMLILTQPLIPGDGVGNTLSWKAGAPADEAALKNETWAAFAGFLQARAAQLRVDPAQMSSPGRVTVHDDGNLIQIWAPRVIGGIPVRDSYVTAVVNHGNLVLFGANNWADFNGSGKARISEETAVAKVADYLSQYETGAPWRRPWLTYVPLAVGETLDQVTPGRGLEYRLAWTVNPSLVGSNGSWQALVDASSGELLSFEDINQYASARLVKGGAYPVSNDGNPPDGVEQLGSPMPFDRVTTSGGTVTTDSGGNLPNPVDGNITSSLSGQYVRMADNCGAISLTSGNDIDFGGSGGDDCTTPGFGGAGNTHSSRTGFYELNRIKEQARGQLPANGWLQGTLTANMNINNTCNAFWNGSTVNFYRSGGGCGNTGELAGVFDHEWGHGMDNNDTVPSISNPGEGIADIYAGLRLDTSCIGRGFFGGNCGGYGDPCIACTGIRDIDWAKRLSGQPHDIAWIDANCGGGPAPCGGIVHCEGAVYSEATWDIYSRTLAHAPYNFDSNTALEATTRLTYLGAGGVGTWYQCTAPFGGCNASGGYLNYLTADDDNGNLNDGTPHMQAIFSAFNLHQIACATPVVQDSGCVGTPTQAPIVTTTPSDKSVQLDWGAVPGATAYEIYRSEGVFACDFGKVKVGTTAGTTFTDMGLQNGRDYSYVVIPKGAGATCWGPASACATEAPAGGPNLAIVTSSFAVTIDTGDGDQFLDNCETATATFDVANTGLGALSNVRILSVTSPSHPQIQILTPFPKLIDPPNLPEGGTGSSSFDFTADGLSMGDTVVFTITAKADELDGDRSADVSVSGTESDFQFFPSVAWDFEADANGWNVIEGTFNRTNANGGGAQGTPFYEQSSAFLDNQCDHIQSPTFSLTPTSTMSLYNRFDIEPIFQGNVWYDRANVGLYNTQTGTRTVVSPSGGRKYNASGPNGTCGTDSQPGWADKMDSWAGSAWTAAALDAGNLAGIPVQIDIRYGTDANLNGFGFRFDQVSVTDVDLVVEDAQSDLCPDTFTLSPPVPGMAGVNNTLSVSNATPGGKVGFAASVTRGNTMLACGAVLGLSNPMILGSATADGNGDANLVKFIPPGASGRTLYFQAVDLSACDASNRVDFAFP